MEILNLRRHKDKERPLKDKERPHTICGLYDSITYFQDSGEIFIGYGTLNYILCEFKEDFPTNNPDYIDNLIYELDVGRRIALRAVLRRFEAHKIKNLCEYLILKINTPEMVENLIIDQLNQIRRDNYMLEDRLNAIALKIQKRR